MISIRALTKEFSVAEGAVRALNRLDLEIDAGSFYVIVGASGSGKTTLLRCVAGLERPNSGEIRLAGKTVFSDTPPVWVAPQYRQLGMVFQSYAIWPHLTVFDNVALPLTDGVQKMARGEALRRRVMEALEIVELAELANRPATLVSGGQQQRVALARAIAVSSTLLLMDEPLSNLDARLREDVRERIRSVAKRLGSTVLYVTHDQVEAMAVADRIALMDHGTLLQADTPLNIYLRPRAPAIADFFGAMNWLSSDIVGPGKAQTPVGLVSFEAEAPSGTEVLLGFRPEALSLLTESAPQGSNVIEGKLAASTFVGDQFLLQLTAGDQLLHGKSRRHPGESGALLKFALKPADVMVFPRGN